MGKTTLNIRINQWIELSQSDLLSSRILHLAGQHRNSYFLFQQSVEKANKALALSIGFTEDELARKVGHDQMKIYKKNIEKKRLEIEDLILTLEQIPSAQNHDLLKPFNFKEYHASLISSLNDIQNLRQKDLVNISADEINYLLDGVFDNDLEEMALPNRSSSEFRNLLSNVADFIKQFAIQPGQVTNEEFESLIKSEENVLIFHKFLKHQINLMSRMAFVEYIFLTCAFLTIQHSSLTRYFDGEKNPMKIYTKKLSLVRKQQEIMDFFEEGLMEFKRVLNSRPITI